MTSKVCVPAAAWLLPLVLLSTVFCFSCSPPDIDRARVNVQRLDPQKNPDRADRKKAVLDILEHSLSISPFVLELQELEDTVCCDPEPEVRAVAIRALGVFVEKEPTVIVKTNLLGMKFIYLNLKMFDTIGRSDPSPEIRIAIAEFWRRADVLWEQGFKSLKEMLQKEREAQVLHTVREEFARRVERSYGRGDIEEKEAKRLQREYKLRGLTLQKAEQNALIY